MQDVTLLTNEDNLNTPHLNRIEGYDISHLSGKETYGSMVVFSGAEPDKAQYRLFKLKEEHEGNDESALLEVLIRRFKHSEWPLPDLLMIDGGSPQISFLTRELAKFNLYPLLVGISKFGGDKLVFARGTKNNSKELAKSLKPVLLKVREEAHRFANFGRKRGSKKRF